MVRWNASSALIRNSLLTTDTFPPGILVDARATLR